MEYLNLCLNAPLFYEPFEDTQNEQTVFFGAAVSAKPETVWHFEINPSQALSIEPEPENYLVRLTAGGRASGGRRTGFVLPAGLYYFTQFREKPGEENSSGRTGRLFVEMAVELQKEALWERHKPEQSVYFRSLREDGAAVFQVLRPLCL